MEANADFGLSVTSFVLISAVSFILYKIVTFLFYVRHLRTVFKGLPSPEFHWLYGNMHLVPKGSDDRLQYAVKNANLFPKLFIFWIGSLNPMVMINHSDIVRQALKTSEPKPTGFMGIYRMGLPWLGEGLLIAGGKKWARSRRLLTPAFHFDILKPYIAIYNDAADILCENLSKMADSTTQFEIYSHISKLTLDIILRCAFSYQTDCQRDGAVSKTHPYVEAVEKISEIWTDRARKPWLYPDWVFYLTRKGQTFKKNCDFVHGVAEDIIQKRKATLKTADIRDKKYLDFLDVLLTARDEEGQGLTSLEIRNEVDTFLFEGHDTTASALSWILYSLADNPDCQRKCQAEIDEILKGRDTDDIEWEDLAKMEYLTMCIKEGMRHHSPVPFIQREFTHDFELDGIVFPAGTTVSLHIYGLHHNKNIWDRPMEYIPERFSKENISKIDTFQFVPFSAGPRNCIGQHFAMNEEKVVLAKLLRKFWFDLDTTHTVKHRVAAVMRSESGIYMYVKHRNNRETVV